MNRISKWLLTVFMILFSMSLFPKPGFIVSPFAKSINIAPNTNTSVLIVAQNNTTVNQTVTNVTPMIPADSGIIGTVIANNCGFLSPGASCESVIRLQSGNNPSQGGLNVSVCSFNGAFCSRIVSPLQFINTVPVRLFVSPIFPSIAQGTTQQFYATSLFSNGTIQDVTNAVTWTSSNTSRATISNASGSEGLAFGIAAGFTAITASLGSLTDSSILTVTPATLTSISVTPVNPTIAKGTTQQFTATGIFSDNTTQDITSLVIWASSNNTIASISNTAGQNGLATGQNPGSVTITATLGAVSGSTNLTVTSAVLTQIFVTPTNTAVVILNTQQFTATGLYSDNTTQDLTNAVTWQSAAANIAIVSNRANSKGLALGTGVGSTTIAATLGNISGSTNLQVTAAVLVSIIVVPSNATLPAGSERSYIALGQYSNHLLRNITTEVTWQSSNTNIASISNAPGSQGLAKGLLVGNVIISATLDGVVGTGNLTVVTPTLVSIAVTPSASTIPAGTALQFTAIGTYSDSSTQDLTNAATWSSSATAVASISNASGSKGLAQSLTAGATTIAATFNGITGNTSLTVSAATLVSINVTPTNSSIAVGTEQQFTATGTYSDASTKNITTTVTWISSNNAVATISNANLSRGLATGVAQGTTTIEAIQNSISGTTTLTVNNSIQTCIVQRRSDSSSYWLGYDIFTDGAPMILNFSATGIDLTQIIVQNGVFSNVQVLDQNQLFIGTKPDWVSMTTPGFIDFYGPNYGPYEPFNSPLAATCQIVS